MDNYYEILKSFSLFKGINEKNFSTLLACLGAKKTLLSKDEIILMEGEKVEHIGIVLSGKLRIIRDDKYGDRSTIAALGVGDFFAEALCVGAAASPVSVISDDNSEVMFIEYGRVLRTCPNSCVFHSKLIENMVFVMAKKNIALQNRMEIISKKTVRRKILTYLENVSKNQGQNIKIPFNREQLAEYLCVDRSALSHELARMKKDGLIDYHKNTFRLL